MSNPNGNSGYFSRGPGLQLLIAGLDRELSFRCLSELKLAGFQPVADDVETISRALEALSARAYDIALISHSRQPGQEDPSLEGQFEGKVPFILISSGMPNGKGLSSALEGAAEVVSPSELGRLPFAVGRALEIKTLREEKERAEGRYRMLFERSLAGIYQASLDGRIIDLNDACVRMFACPSKERIIGCPLREITASRDEYDRLMLPLLDRQTVSSLEIELRRRNGEPFWALASASVLDHGKEALIEGTLIEITEWKRAEEAVRQSENRFKALVENSADAISLVDATGKVILSSHAVSPIFGYALEERVGKNIFELIHPDDQRQVLPAFAELLQNPSGSVTTQVRYRHKDGTWRWIEALGTNMLEDPSVRAVVINYRDVTERRLLLQQLFQAQKMEAVGQLAGGVAHDFNNLLTAILGYSDMVLEKLPRNSAARRYTTEIRKAGERAASLTRQLLAFSRLQMMSPQVIDLNAVIEELSKMLHRLIGENVTLSIIPGGDPGRIKADPTQIEQVIMNLAVNARDALPDGGKLSIETTNVILDETVTAEGVRVKAGPYVLMEVSDSGTGMDNATKARIFEPFFTTKEKGKGTGLGLSTVYGIVKQSGGYIWVSSELGHGTTFKIYLPAVEEDLSVQKPQGVHERKHMGSETVMVVEDEDSVRILLGKLLRNMGYHVLEASLAEEALELSKKYGKAIHLMLTDIAMPGMNGQELARLVKGPHPETNVLFMTGYAGNKVGSASVLEQNSHFIHKPFTSDVLGRKIRDILDVPAS
ncbi:MAG: PAS domain S-box protein [Terriglobia bacterium]